MMIDRTGKEASMRPPDLPGGNVLTKVRIRSVKSLQ